MRGQLHLAGVSGRHGMADLQHQRAGSPGLDSWAGPEPPGGERHLGVLSHRRRRRVPAQQPTRQSDSTPSSMRRRDSRLSRRGAGRLAQCGTGRPERPDGAGLVLAITATNPATTSQIRVIWPAASATTTSSTTRRTRRPARPGRTYTSFEQNHATQIFTRTSCATCGTTARSGPCSSCAPTTTSTR